MEVFHVNETNICISNSGDDHGIASKMYLVQFYD